jgi:uncharacterized damage-inducible protein DinB
MGGTFMYNSVSENLEETRNNLVREISALSYAKFNTKPDENSWSIAQICHHLVLTEKATTKAIARGLKEVDSTEKERKNVQLILNRSKKIKAPKMVEPAEDSFEVQKVLNLLEESRQNFISFLSTIEEPSILTKKSMQHPALGELPLDQWIDQIYLHEQRHMEQIKETKAYIGSNN